MLVALIVLMAVCTLFSVCIVFWADHPLILKLTRPIRVACIVLRSRGRVSWRYAWRVLTFEDYYLHPVKEK